MTIRADYQFYCKLLPLCRRNGASIYGYVHRYAAPLHPNPLIWHFHAYLVQISSLYFKLLHFLALLTRLRTTWRYCSLPTAWWEDIYLDFTLRPITEPKLNKLVNGTVLLLYFIKSELKSEWKVAPYCKSFQRYIFQPFLVFWYSPTNCHVIFNY